MAIAVLTILTYYALDPVAADPMGAAVGVFASYGVVGAVAIGGIVAVYRLWMNGQRTSAEALNREIEKANQERLRAERAEQINADLNREVREKIIPALVDVTRASADLVDLRNRDRGRG